MNNNKNIVNFLLYRYKELIPFAAIYQSYINSLEHYKTNNLPMPEAPEVIKIKPFAQLNIIKNRLIEMYPNLQWIKNEYDSSIKLTTEDFIDIYSNHELLIIEKIIKQLEKIID